MHTNLFKGRFKTEKPCEGESLGGFSLKKVVEGVESGDIASDLTFTVTASWTVDGESQSRDFILNADGTVVEGLQDLPVGTVVTFSEATAPEIDGYAFSDVSFEPKTVKIADATTVQVEVTNTYTKVEEPEPSIGTTVQVKGSDTKVLPFTGGTVVNTVEYKGLTPGVKYELKGEIRTVPAGEPTGITATGEFTPNSAEGTTTVTFEITGDQVKQYAGQELVVFEYLYDGATKVAEHTDPEDKAQTFTVEKQPEPKTGQFTVEKQLSGIEADAFPVDASFLVTATWNDDNGDEAKVSVEIPADGTPVTVENIPVGATVTFSEPAPVTAVGYEFDRVEFDPSSLTITEGDNGKVVATNFYTVIPEPEPGKGKITVSKEVTGTGSELVDGKEFTFTFRCEAAENPNPLSDVDEEQSLVDALSTFAASMGESFTLKAGESKSFDVPEGMTCFISEEVPAAVDGAIYNGVEYTIDGELLVGNPEIDVVADQHVTVKASNTYTKIEEPEMGYFQVKKVVAGVQDQELLKGLTFDVVATWDGGSETLTLPATGEYVRSTTELPVGTVVTFTESTDEVVIAGYTFASADIVPKSVTIMQDASVEAIVTNTYIKDAEPAIGTKATVTADPTDNILPITGGEVIDTVSYTNLDPETEYRLDGELMHVAADGTVTATGILGSTTFTTPAAAAGEFYVSGTIDVTFTLTAEQAYEYGGETLVVFEDLFLVATNELIADHRDPEDEGQSFRVEEREPEIGTRADVTGTDTKVLPVTGGEVIDTVSYTDLKPSTEYRLDGELMHVAADGTVTATGILGTTTFTTPAAAAGEFYVSGTIDVVFTISGADATQYAGQKLVVFEELFDVVTNEPVAEHKDPEDEDQSFEIEPGGTIIVGKKVTGPKGDQVERDDSSVFQVRADWIDSLGNEQSRIFNVTPAEPVSLEGLPLNTEIVLSEIGADTDVTNVKWGDIIWSGTGVVDQPGNSPDGIVTLENPGATVQVGLENKTSSNGLIIIPIPIPLPPAGAGPTPSPAPVTPVTPPAPPEVAPVSPVSPKDGIQPQGAAPQRGAAPQAQQTGLAATGADVVLLAGGGIAILILGAWLVLRGRRNES